MIPAAEVIMRRLLAILFVISAVATAQTTADKLTVIKAGSLLDVKSGDIRHNQIIVIRGNKIESVSDAASSRAPAGANVIDLARGTVLPGLIDSHTHIFLQGEDPVQ